MLQIYGGGGHGRVIAEAYQLNNPAVTIEFYDDRQSHGKNTSFLKQNIPVIIGIGNNNTRKEIVASLDMDHIFINVCHPFTSISETLEMGYGNFIAAGCCINNDSVVGNHNILNTRASIDHEVNIGSYNHIAPGSIICGDVKICDNVFLGAGSVVLPGIKIVSNVIVGAGSVVTKDLTKPGVYVGSPARLI